MKIRSLVLGVAALSIASFTAPAFAGSGPDSPTVTKGVGNALAAERAGRNSNGGDRAQGGFGPAQSDYVNSINEGGGNYGQWLTDDWCGGGNCGN